MNAILGIDVSKQKLDAALRWGDYQKRQKTFTNTQDGFQKMLDWAQHYTKDPLHVCTEYTGIYDEAVAEFFYEKGIKVSRVNPMAIKAFGKSLMTRTKTDSKDSLVIAGFAQAHNPPAWAPDPEYLKQFKALSRCLEALKEDYQRAANRLEKTSKRTHCPSRLVWVQQVERLEEAIKDVEKNLNFLMKSHPNLTKQCELLQTIPGIGQTTAWRLIAEIPSLQNFKNAAQLAAYAGIVPKHKQSGSSVRGQSRLSKIGSSRLRKALYFPVLVAKQYNPVLAYFWGRLLQKGKNKMTAIGACMRKLLHIIFGVLKHQKPFNSQLST